MWRRVNRNGVFKNIDCNFAQSLAGLAIIAISIALWLDRDYFFWPPELASAMNDRRLDIIILILGIGLLFSALIDNKSKFWQHLLLILCGAVVCMLALTQLWHAFLADQMRMAHTAVEDFIIFILIMRAAYKS